MEECKINKFNSDGTLKDNISVCQNCGKHTNDDKGETFFDADGTPFCLNCKN